jgi:hypothetical protein
MAAAMSLNDVYRDKLRTAIWCAIVEASTETGPDGRRIAIVRSSEALDATVWVQATLLTTLTQAQTSDGLRAFSGKMEKRLRALTRALRRDGIASLFDILPDVQH